MRVKQIDFSRIFTAAAFSAIVAAAAACTPASPAPTPVASEPIASSLALSTFDSLWTVVRNTYVDTAFVSSSWTAVRDSLRPKAATVSSRRELTDVLASALGRIPDSHFYIIPERVANESDSNDATGAGGTTGLSVRAIGDNAVAWKVERGSPAALSGITPGQTISSIGNRDLSAALKKVNDVPVAGRARALSEVLFSFNHAVSPASGATVNARVQTGAKTVDHTMVAVPASGTVSQFGNLPPIAGRVSATKVQGPDNQCVGVIAFSIWLPALVPEMERGMDSLSGCRGIVVDLRGNPGGVGGMVMGFGGYFVDSAISLGTMRSRQLSLHFAMNPRRVKSDGSPASPFHGPLAILVDPMTASTSEIFATGMQRIGRARIFGERSAGAALPALMDRLPSGDVFVHAIADFTDPDGKRIEGAGVTPDEITPLSGKDLAEGRDTALEAAVRWIKSSPAVPRAPASQAGNVHPNIN